MCELLSPVGDFECLKAAVQNGADSVYLGASSFSARARAKNFDMSELKKAVEYAKTRNVKVHLTLNTLIKNDEFEDAVNLAIQSYNVGVDAIIIQDIGLAAYLLKNYPEIKLHASTQMTCHNLDGVKQLEALGFKRVVLSRELSIDEIRHIRENTSCELEVFVHGALCISYSGQCLLSSMIGGRSGNRGLCAQPCRMYYNLLEESSNGYFNKIDSGYLLSPKDNLGIEYLSELIDMGIDSFKIEGRMKTPLYVATVTKIYRKYIDYIKTATDRTNVKNNIQKMLTEINEKTNLSDIEMLIQVFNRGGMSNAHFSSNGNNDLIYKKAPNNIGILLGKIQKFNESKGYIFLKTSAPISIGDKIMINDSLYNVSELMINGHNQKKITDNNIVTIGRVKGNIKPGDIVRKIEDTNIAKLLSPTYSEEKEFKKISIDGSINIFHNQNITFKLTGKTGFYKNIHFEYISDIKPEKAINIPTSKDRIKEQLIKTGNTPFKFDYLEINCDDNLFLNMKDLNEIRRKSIEGFINEMLNNFTHSLHSINIAPIVEQEISSKCTTVLLNELNLEEDYTKLSNSIDELYIPLKYFINNNYASIVSYLTENYKVYIYLPNIMRDTFLKKIDFSKVLNVKTNGFVISNISQLETLKTYKHGEYIGNYTLNVYNNYAVQFLKELGLSTVTISPELKINDFYPSLSNEKIIIYGKIPVMTNQYCYLGKSTKCQLNCDKKCQNGKKYFIEDKFGSRYRIIPDYATTITTMYFDKEIEISSKELQNIRLDFLDETIEEINQIVKTTF